MALPMFLPTSRVPDPVSAPPMNWGIIAPGGIAHMFASALRGAPRQRVVAVASRSPERGRAFAAEFGVPTVHSSYADLVADPQVQIVYVASPHTQHAEQALLAIGAGKHVLVEKPFARNAKEARRVVVAARKAQVAVMEAMWTRFLPRTDIVRQLLADGTLGTIETVIADHGQLLPADLVPRLHDPQLAGGSLLDLGIYPISFAAVALGVPGAVLATASMTPTGVDRQVAALLTRFADHPQAQALVTCTLAAKTPTSASISGGLGRIELDGEFFAPGRVRLVAPSGESITSEPPEMVSHQGLAYEAAHLAQLVSDGFTESPQLPLDETVAIMEVLDTIRSQVKLRFPGE